MPADVLTWRTDQKLSWCPLDVVHEHAGLGEGDPPPYASGRSTMPAPAMDPTDSPGTPIQLWASEAPTWSPASGVPGTPGLAWVIIVYRPWWA